MIAKLFRRLTADAAAGNALFDWATRMARLPGWYVKGGVPDTIDGRFAVLSTIVALCCLRLEQLGREGDALSVALTERFADVMESEHRELGMGDPTLGKTVLKLVGSLAKRVDLLRPAMAGTAGWGAVVGPVFPGGASETETAWRADELQRFAMRLKAAGLEELGRGDVE